MNKLKILILEDDAIISLYISQVISNLDCELISVVTNADDAIKSATRFELDLLIADIKIIGDIDGIDTAKILQEKYNCEVLFLTANIDNETIRRASEINSLGYLIKPFKQNELIAILKMAIQRKMNIKVIEFCDNFKYDPHSKLLTNKDKNISLTHSEIILLEYLIKQKNKIVDYDTLTTLISPDYPSIDSIRTIVKSIRHKSDKTLIKNLSGVGYKVCIK